MLLDTDTKPFIGRYV